MKNLYKIIFGFLILFFSTLLQNCAKENETYIFKHDNNLITQMVCRTSHTSGEFRAEIHEFDKDGKMMDDNFTQADVEGGYGLILFPISKSLEKDIDLTNVYLSATLTYDAIVTPSLTGRKNISGNGMIITVTSGENTKRQYRIRGYFE